MSVFKNGFTNYSVSNFVRQANARSYSKYYFAYRLFLISFYYFHALKDKGAIQKYKYYHYYGYKSLNSII